MIITVLNGGLGNQLFQYAAGLALAERHNTGLIVDLRFYDRDYTAEFYRPPLLQRMGININHRDYAESGGRNSLWRRFKRKLLLLRYQLHQHMELEFDSEVATLPDWTMLMGLYQSESYFEDIGDRVRSEIPLEPLLVSIPVALQDQVKQTESVALHVRRTDYLHESRFMLQNIDRYYQDALELMQSRLTKPHFFIFSDDVEWCKSYPPIHDLGQSKTIVELEDSLTNPERELALMATCKHQIIANSSFSWWGAWLNPNPDKVVVYPSVWFAGVDTDQAQICPENWISIDNSSVD